MYVKEFLHEVLISISHLSFFFSIECSTGTYIAWYDNRCLCIITGCGGVFTADSGLITTPPHLTAYKNDQNCTWLITVDSTKNVEFKSVSFIALVIFVNITFNTIIIIGFCCQFSCRSFGSYELFVPMENGR